MKYNFFSNSNPFFRRNLFDSLHGKNLTDIKIRISNRVKEYHDELFFFLSGKNLVTLEFDETILINVGAANLSLFEIRERYPRSEQFAFQQDKFRGFSAFAYQNEKNSFEITLKKLGQPQELIDLLGKKVVDCSLLKESSKFRVEVHTRLSNYLECRGIKFLFETGESLFIVHYSDDIIFRTSLKSIGEAFEKPSLFNYELLEETSIFLESGQPFQDEEGTIYCIPKEKVDESLLIDRRQIIPKTLLFAKDILKFKVNGEELKNALEKYPEIDINAQIDFLTELKEDFIKDNYGLADLKFGIDKNYSLRLIKPLDIVLHNKENLLFIDSIIEVLEEFRKWIG